MTNALTTTTEGRGGPLTPDDVMAQVGLIQEVMSRAMHDGEHYGVIPGTNKPTLLQPGAQKLMLTFRYGPAFEVTPRDLDGGHREYGVLCTLKKIGSEDFVGQGCGMCSTMETKYRYRQAERVCPKCGKPSIIKGKAEFGGGWLCWGKKGGCGAKFSDGAPEIETQLADRIENPDIADCYNTVLKMAKKRALVDATLNATAASDIFTQDMEDAPAAAPAPVKAYPAPQKAAVPNKARVPITEQIQKSIAGMTLEKFSKAAEFILASERRVTITTDEALSLTQRLLGRVDILIAECEDVALLKQLELDVAASLARAEIDPFDAEWLNDAIGRRLDALDVPIPYDSQEQQVAGK